MIHFFPHKNSKMAKGGEEMYGKNWRREKNWREKRGWLMDTGRLKTARRLSARWISRVRKSARRKVCVLPSPTIIARWGEELTRLFSLRIYLLERRIRNDFGCIVCYDDSSISLSNISFHLSKPRFLRRDERVEGRRAWIENCDNEIDVIGDWVWKREKRSLV